MNWMRIAIALGFLAVNLGVALWDLYCAAVGRPLDTVSYVIQEWSQRFAVIPLLVGMVVGHVFWPTRPH